MLLHGDGLEGVLQQCRHLVEQAKLEIGARLHAREKCKLLHLVIAQKIQRMQEKRKLETTLSNQAKRCANVGARELSRMHRQVDDVTHVNRHTRERHRGHWDLEQLPRIVGLTSSVGRPIGRRQCPEVRLQIAQPLAGGAEELLAFFSLVLTWRRRKDIPDRPKRGACPD